jgi:MFS family permease
MVAMFLAAADQTILASALPTIASSLGGITDLSWVVVAYLLAATVAAPLYGYLGDRFGRRRVLLGALAIFTGASVACALAPNFLWLVVFRAAQGLGGGGLMTLTQALIGEHVSPRERGRFAGYFATVFALPAPPGRCLAPISPALQLARSFLINVPGGGGGVVIARAARARTGAGRSDPMWGAFLRRHGHVPVRCRQTATAMLGVVPDVRAACRAR